MAKVSRWFTRGLALGLLTVWCAAPVMAASADKLLPSDTDAVVHVNVKALIESELVKKYALEEIKNGLKNNQQIGVVLGLLNFDPLKDISNVTLAVGLGGNIQEPDMLVIAHGNFDLDKIHSVLAEVAKNMADKVKVSSYGDVKVYEGKGQGEGTGYFAFLDKATIVGSNSKAQVEGAIDQSKGKKEGKLKKEVAAAVEKADGSLTVWAAGALPGPIKELAKASPQGEIVDKIEAITFGVNVKDSVALDITIHATDDKVAEDLRGQMEQGLQIGQALVLQNEQVGAIATDFINAIKLSAKGPKMIISATFTGEMIDKATKKAKEGAK